MSHHEHDDLKFGYQPVSLLKFFVLFFFATGQWGFRPAVIVTWSLKQFVQWFEEIIGIIFNIRYIKIYLVKKLSLKRQVLSILSHKGNTKTFLIALKSPFLHGHTVISVCGVTHEDYSFC